MESYYSINICYYNKLLFDNFCIQVPVPFTFAPLACMVTNFNSLTGYHAAGKIAYFDCLLIYLFNIIFIIFKIIIHYHLFNLDVVSCRHMSRYVD